MGLVSFLKKNSKRASTVMNHIILNTRVLGGTLYVADTVGLASVGSTSLALG